MHGEMDNGVILDKTDNSEDLYIPSWYSRKHACRQACIHACMDICSVMCG